MERCPECDSFNTRKSKSQSASAARKSHAQPEPAAPRARLPFYAWFRCRDCGARFLALDHLLIQQSLTAVVALTLIGAFSWWAATHQPGADTPPQFEATALVLQGGSPQSWNSKPDPSNPRTREAAAEGDPEAQFELGLDIVQQAWQQGEQSAFGEATNWFHKAAEQDHVRAQFVLGTLYEKGRGVVQDYEQAMRWYRRAAEQGHALAMARLGLMHKTGRGVDKNLVEAYVWLNLASARGDLHAEVDRERLRLLLSAEQLRDAQQLSRRFDRQLPRLSDVSLPLPADF